VARIRHATVIRSRDRHAEERAGACATGPGTVGRQEDLVGDARISDPSGALLTTGRRAWALLGIVGVLAVAAFVLSRFSLVLIAAGLALFPAALLSAPAEALRRRGVPGALIGAGGVLFLYGAVVGTIAFLVPRFAAEVPMLVEAVRDGLGRVDDLLAAGRLPVDAESLDDIGRQAMDAVGGADGLVGPGVEAARIALDAVIGIVLGSVALFFYLKDGSRIWRGFADLAPRRARRDLDIMTEQVWWTLGAYFRGQLLVALFDAVFIGLGLLLLGVPLALPLAVIVFLGGLFPIVGAFVSGLLAVLVAFADGGITTALLVLGLVVLVQQVESNLLEPLILSKVIALHPLPIVLAVTAGAGAFGLLGAFLAVPLWACTARVVDHLRGRRPPAGPASEIVDDGGEPGGSGESEDTGGRGGSVSLQRS
jgi:putative heme transporter